MNAFAALKNTQKFRTTGDPFDDRLRDMQEEDQLAQGEAAKKAEFARLENRKIMREEMAKREEAKNRPSGMPDPDWKPGIPADMLTRDQNKWGTFYDNETRRANYGALAGEGMPSPGGAHIMGGGGVIQSAGENARARTDALSALAANAYGAQGGDGGGGTSGGGGGGGGKVTMSPGGNYSRGPTYDDFDIERLRQARAQTKALEESVPSTAAERQRNQIAFDINTGRYKFIQEHLGDMARDEQRKNAIWEADTQNQPAVWREDDIKWRRQQELFDRELQKLGLQGENQLRVALAAAGGRMGTAKIAADAKIQGDIRRQWAEAFKTPATSPEEKAMRQKILTELYQKAQEMGMDPIELLMDNDLVQRGPAPPAQNQPATANTPRTVTPVRSGNPGYDALMNSVR